MLGDIVIFVDATFPGKVVEYAALVTAVNKDGTYNLAVFVDRVTNIYTTQQITFKTNVPNISEQGKTESFWTVFWRERNDTAG